LAATPGGTTITVAETDTGRPQLSLEYPAFLQSVRFSPDATRLAGGGAAGMTLVWDAASGTTLVTLDSRTTLVNGLAFSPDGRVLATTGNDGLVRLWDVASGRQLVARSHGGSSFGVAFSPDSRRLASSSVDRAVKLWAVAGHSLGDEEPLTLTGHTAAGTAWPGARTAAGWQRPVAMGQAACTPWSSRTSWHWRAHV